MENGLVSQEQAEAIRLVDQLLDRMSGEENSSLWDFKALRTSPEWAEVRKLARAALATLESSDRIS